MLNLLKRLRSKDLYYAVGVKKVGSINSISSVKVTKESDIELLANLVLAIYSTDLLYEKKIRCLLFSLIEPGKLKVLAKKNANRSYSKTMDNALALSNCSWRSITKFVLEVAKELGIPKEFLPKKSANNQVVEVIEPVDKLFDLHGYQEEVKAKTLELLNNKVAKFLIQMPTGAGKTRTAIESLLENILETDLFKQQRSIVWMAHTEELCEQAIDTFKDVWQNLANSPTQIVRCWGTFEPTIYDINGSFVVCTFQKLYSLLRKKSDLFFAIKDACKIVIVDEAHKSIANTFAKVINQIVNSSDSTLIGLTATPGRGKEAERENKELARYFGKNLVTPNFKKNPIEELREKKVLAKLNHRVIETGVGIKMKSDSGEANDIVYDIPSTVIGNLSNNTARNKIILEVIESEQKLGNPCLVFSCSVEHSRMLSAATNLLGCASGYIDCGMRKGSRRRVIDEFRQGKLNVLFNYGVLSTGFDSPRIKTVIITRPTSSIVLYSQMVGRGLRGPLMGGSETCNLIDIKDNYSNFGGVEAVYNHFDDYWE